MKLLKVQCLAKNRLNPILFISFPDAIESMRQEVIIPDTGSLIGDIDELVNNAAEVTLHPTRKQTAMMIVNSAGNSDCEASRRHRFAQIYQQKYLQLRRYAFAIIIERAKARKEIKADLDTDLVFDTMSGIMLYALVFPPNNESWSQYVRRSLDLMLTGASS